MQRYIHKGTKKAIIYTEKNAFKERKEKRVKYVLMTIQQNNGMANSHGVSTVLYKNFVSLPRLITKTHLRMT